MKKEFKIGDRVMVIANKRHSKLFGHTGTVKSPKLPDYFDSYEVLLDFGDENMLLLFWENELALHTWENELALHKEKNYGI
jgi:hypothetical protein